MIQTTNKIRGYSIIELLFYIGLFSIVALLVINALFTMTKTFKETTVQAELVESSSIMEKISREVRKAYSVNSINVGNNDLTLNSSDDNGNPILVELKLVGTNVQFLTGSVSTTLVGNLNSPNISVTSLSFTTITTSQGQAIKISLIVRSNNDTLSRTMNFYDTVVLRGHY